MQPLAPSALALQPALPWWRVPTAWLVFAGPALVVVASMVTLVLAVHGRDLPLANAAEPDVHAPGAMTPATQARNHAATPAGSQR